MFRDLFFFPLRQHSWWSLASRCPVFCPATNSYFIFSSLGKGHLEPHVPPPAPPCLYIFRDQLLSLTSLQIILLTCSSFQSWGNAFSRSCALTILNLLMTLWASQVVLVVKNPPANAGDTRDMGSIPGSGRSARVGNGNSPQYSCLENSVDRGSWQATVHRVAKSQDTMEHACFNDTLRGTLFPISQR